MSVGDTLFAEFTDTYGGNATLSDLGIAVTPHKSPNPPSMTRGFAS